MPDHRIRFHAVGPPQRGQRQLQSHDHRLHPRIPGDRFTIGEQLLQRKPHLLKENRLQLGDRRREHRLIGEQLPAHPRPLRTLTRIHEHRARPTRPLMGIHHPGRRLTGGQRLQPGHRLGAVTRTHRRELAVPGAVMVDGVGDIGQRHLSALADHPLGQHRRRRRDPCRASCPTPPKC